jgi:dihydroorotase
MNQILIKNAKIVNEGKIFEGDVLIEDQFIVEIAER